MGWQYLKLHEGKRDGPVRMLVGVEGLVVVALCKLEALCDADAVFVHVPEVEHRLWIGGAVVMLKYYGVNCYLYPHRTKWKTKQGESLLVVRGY